MHLMFTKMVQLVPLKEYDAQTMANKFLSTVVNQSGLPKCIKIDYHNQFCSHFSNELMSLLKIILTFSIAFYPQKYGMNEIMNCTIKHLLYIHA